MKSGCFNSYESEAVQKSASHELPRFPTVTCDSSHRFRPRVELQRTGAARGIYLSKNFLSLGGAVLRNLTELSDCAILPALFRTLLPPLALSTRFDRCRDAYTECLFLASRSAAYAYSSVQEQKQGP